ncbi:hypothetical protein AVEN_111443-1 [Araneus ventricosus]|uniref:Reverse transcriptase RNase H-like domain-containing protein n=1 Tax=Araneus ventricosus TaxID=182803 RepID=A0A4Y2K2H0_ARAVE|nr:hypothetical protein AVEN_111443-1 [Araneus ventricosus]
MSFGFMAQGPDLAMLRQTYVEMYRQVVIYKRFLKLKYVSVKECGPTRMRWATIEREAYAVLEALKKYDTWIFGAHIQVISDHNPLMYLTQQTPHSAKITRWPLALRRYDVTISYRKGSRHGNVDSLSRLPLK